MGAHDDISAADRILNQQRRDEEQAARLQRIEAARQADAARAAAVATHIAEQRARRESQ